MTSKYYSNLRLIINGVKGPLYRARLPPPCPALVRQQVEADEGIWTVFGEGYQVSGDTRDKTASLQMLPGAHCLGLWCLFIQEDLDTEESLCMNYNNRLRLGPRRQGRMKKKSIFQTAKIKMQRMMSAVELTGKRGPQQWVCSSESCVEPSAGPRPGGTGSAPSRYKHTRVSQCHFQSLQLHLYSIDDSGRDGWWAWQVVR